MIVVGLTGSIAMGKTESAKIFRSLGIPVFDSDAEVHRLYSKGGAAVEHIWRLFPDAVIDGVVDRTKLSQRVFGNPAALRSLEEAIHPLVRSKEAEFVDVCRKRGSSVVVLDIPLLFETGQTVDVDKIVVVSASADIQRQRALRRRGMTQAKLEQILAEQMPDEEKCARADYVVDTSGGLDHARIQIRAIIADLMHKGRGAGP